MNLEEQLSKSKATKKLIDYLIRESEFKNTEFRLVVQDGGDCYIHVMNRDSETFDFSLKSSLTADENIISNYNDPNIVDIASMMKDDLIRLESMIDRDKYWRERIEKQIKKLEENYSVDSDWDSEIYQLKLLLK